ncbi:MAG TPA: SRPBCC domain-containing protein [Thermoanaerobaculia bacterium]|nr:SRPBCC domain-containing protein [Thermoanaerobaculia bacterium]
MKAELNETLDRRITIRARRETVFAYFTDSARFARWWGEGSRIDAREGCEVFIRNPNGVTVTGKILEVEPPERIVFTYLSAGVESLVTIRLEETAGGTELHLRHAFSSAKIRDHFVQGWRYQLALFSKLVGEDSKDAVARNVDAFFRAWGEPDGGTRRKLLESCATREISFRDAYSATDGLDDLLANLDAIQVHMPGVTLSRSGDVRLSHGTALADWTAMRGGEPMGAGTNVFDLSPDGRIARAAGFWGK